MKKLAIRIVEVKYSGNINDYTIEDLEKMAWKRMQDRGDFTPDKEETVSDEEAVLRDGKVWIDNILDSNKLVYVGMSHVVEDISDN